jgi:hypothetical protein
MRTARFTLPSVPRHTALIVPVPETDAYVVDHPPGVGAHVTVLAWFLEPDAIDEDALRDVFEASAAFDFVLDYVSRFPDGITWLHPEPSQPFSDLTNAVWRRWPDCPPYGGIHDDVVPHVTIAKTPVHVDAPLPIRSVAREVVLIEETEPGGEFAARLHIPLR